MALEATLFMYWFRARLCPLWNPQNPGVSWCFMFLCALGFPIRHLMRPHWIPLGTPLDPIGHPCASHWAPAGPHWALLWSLCVSIGPYWAPWAHNAPDWARVGIQFCYSLLWEVEHACFLRGFWLVQYNLIWPNIVNYSQCGPIWPNMA